MSWTVGKHRVDYVPSRSIRYGPGKLVIDHREELKLVPDLPIELGRATGRIKLAFDHGVSWPELWLDDARVPATPEDTEQRRAPEGASCAVHERGAGAYRSQSAPARFLCGVCGRAACTSCTAIDRVLCRDCFDAGLAIEVWKREAHRRERAIKVGIGAALTGATGVFAGVEWKLMALALGSAGFAFLGGVMAGVNRRKWKQKPHASHALWGVQVPRLPSR